jgi:uncharacterized membrane protein YjfL (UPF0719 family)
LREGAPAAISLRPPAAPHRFRATETGLSMISIPCISSFGLALIEPLQSSGGSKVVSALLGLGLGIVQFVVGLSIAAFAINKGFALVSRMLEGINIWAEVKKKNMAVALLAAGVVISYTNVIAGGIKSMTDGLGSLTSGEWSGGVSAIVGGILNLAIALLVAGFGISVTFTVMDKMTTDIDEKEELKNNNIAIGIVYAGILIGVSSMISAGVSGIGGAVTNFLHVLIAS